MALDIAIALYMAMAMAMAKALSLYRPKLVSGVTRTSCWYFPLLPYSHQGTEMVQCNATLLYFS